MNQRILTTLNTVGLGGAERSRRVFIPVPPRHAAGQAGLFLLTITIAAAAAGAQQQTGSPAGIPVPPPPTAATASADTVATASHSFRIRLLDGRNGAPVAGGHVRLWYDEPAGEGYIVVTDVHGIALMPAPVGQPVRILADIAGSTDCRKPERYTPKPSYALADIAAKGSESDNVCGNIAVRTSPGELVLFVRPARWYEKLNRNGAPNLP